MSLNIEKNISDKSVIIVSGRIDSITASELEEVLEEVIPNTNDLVLDFENLEYISSAGLRVVLKAQKEMSPKGTLTLVHVPKAVEEVFEITGFVDFLTIEK